MSFIRPAPKCLMMCRANPRRSRAEARPPCVSRSTKDQGHPHHICSYRSRTHVPFDQDRMGCVSPKLIHCFHSPKCLAASHLFVVESPTLLGFVTSKIEWSRRRSAVPGSEFSVPAPDSRSCLTLLHEACQLCAGSTSADCGKLEWDQNFPQSFP